MELGKAAGAAEVMGIISIPGRLSRHSIEVILEPVPAFGGFAVLPIGVMLTDDGI